MRFKIGDVVRTKDGNMVTIDTIGSLGYYCNDGNRFNIQYTDEMLEQRFPVVGDRIVNNEGIYFKIENVFYGDINIYVEGINENEIKDSCVIDYNNYQIIEPEPEYSIVEEWERYWNGYYDKELGEPNNQWQWSQKTGRKFKKYADGKLELVEVK